MRITPQLLVDATHCGQAAAAVYASHIETACSKFNISTPVRMAAFLAQIGHESGGLKYVREIWGPTPAQSRYEGRTDLGNTQPGDGERYMGRGLLQVTGRDNYRRMASLLRDYGAPDFEAAPEALEEAKWAVWSAACWWQAHGCNELADSGDFEGLTRRINGGLNGLEDRKARWRRANAALLPVASRTDYEGAPAPEPAPEPAQQPVEESTVIPLAPVMIKAVLPSLLEAIPRLGKIFSSGSEVAERNLGAAQVAIDAVVKATNSINAQDAADKVKTDPVAAQTARKAIDDIWTSLEESGGGGIDGARKADAEVRHSGDMLHSASFWIAMTLMPLLYIVVLSLIGMIGKAEWSNDVRAGLVGSIVSAIVGALVGYYFGQTTSRNRTPTQGG